jgi:hypothetical protein
MINKVIFFILIYGAYDNNENGDKIEYDSDAGENEISGSV